MRLQRVAFPPVAGCVALVGIALSNVRAGDTAAGVTRSGRSVIAVAPAQQPVDDIQGGDEDDRNGNSEARRYAGRTLDEWRGTMKDLAPADPASAVHVPGLIALVRDPEIPAVTRRQAALTLGRIGPRAADAVPLLIELLSGDSGTNHDPDLATATWAAKALALFGPEARAAAPVLVRLHRDGWRTIGERATAIEALGRIGAAHPAVLPALIETLSAPPSGADRDALRTAAEFRGLAAEALGSIGPPASAAVPALVRAASDEDETVRRRVIAALGAMRDSAAPAIATLVDALAFDESPAVRDAAAAALGGIGAPAVPTLAHLLADRDQEIRLRSAAALADMGALAEPAVPALETALADEVPAVRLRTAQALWKVARKGDRTVPVAVGLLANRDRQLRIAASRLLVEIAPHDARVADSLRELAESDESHIRRAAQETLEKIARAAAKRD
ncbi:MAG: HEAT repeat domain-containing protein [Planctomycetales bacterium]